MAENKKIALLDTDFVSKTHIIQKDATHCLADFVIALPNYSFCCHQKTVDELSLHGIAGSPQWLQDQITAGIVRCYTDRDILHELRPYYGDSSQSVYLQYLKNSCDAFDANYFTTYFGPLTTLSPSTDDATFLQTLDACEQAIGHGRSLGEKKSLVLLQLLQFLQPNNVYVFCSDDKGARTGVVSIGGVHCISILSLFYQLKEQGYPKLETEPYFNSYEAFLTRTNPQPTFKVWADSKTPCLCRIPCRQVYDEIYANRFTLLRTGDLRYRS